MGYFTNITPVAVAATGHPSPTYDLQSNEYAEGSEAQDGSRSAIPRPDRPGKFPGLKGFVTKPQSNNNKYRNVYAELPLPGDIIHITEEEAGGHPYGVRLHERVMLVLRPVSNCAMTCIPFCLHVPRRPDPGEGHWMVSTTEPARDDQSKVLLLVKLDDELELRPGITINLTELWHVEYDHLSLNIIGHVSERSWQPLLERVVALFAASLLPKESFRIGIDRAAAAALTPQHPVEVPERKSGGQMEAHHHSQHRRSHGSGEHHARDGRDSRERQTSDRHRARIQRA